MIEFYSLDFTIEMQGVGTVKRSGGGGFLIEQIGTIVLWRFCLYVHPSKIISNIYRRYMAEIFQYGVKHYSINY